MKRFYPIFLLLIVLCNACSSLSKTKCINSNLHVEITPVSKTENMYKLSTRLIQNHHTTFTQSDFPFGDIYGEESYKDDLNLGYFLIPANTPKPVRLTKIFGKSCPIECICHIIKTDDTIKATYSYTLTDGDEVYKDSGVIQIK